MAAFSTRLQHAWSAFTGRDPTYTPDTYRDNDPFYGASISTLRPDRPRLMPTNEATIVSSIYNRIATDVSTIDIRHVQLDEDNNFLKVKNTRLNECLSLSANVDQTGRALIQDLVMSMFDEGSVAVVITEATADPRLTDAYDIGSLRVGKIKAWAPTQVQVEYYNERTGRKTTKWFNKSCTAIIENPFYSIMNEPNSTLKRLIRKMAILDRMDDDISARKLDIIIQLPYEIRNESRKKQAKSRRGEIENQLKNSPMGIAYTGASEKIMQLNRSVENQLPAEVEALTKELYNKIGLTESILNGTASEEEMLNYYSRTLEPILLAITEEFTRKFLSRTARAQHKAITFFRDPFKLVPISKLAEIFGTLIQSEVISNNEARGILGRKPSDNPRDDELMNPNINPADVGDSEDGYETEDYEEEGGENQNGDETL